MKTLPLLLTTLAFALPASICLAAKNADLKSQSAKAGKVLFEDNFDASALGKQWAVNKGEWVIKDSAVAGASKKEENHAGVLFLNVPNHNSIIRFSFQMDGKGFNLSYNSAGGHLFRILVTADGLTVNKDRDKKDEKSKNEALAEAKGKIEPGQWHTMMVEVQGGKITVQTDTGLKTELSNSALDVDKTGYRFVTGTSVLIDDVKVWAVE
jgi:hypothetical protein